MAMNKKITCLIVFVNLFCLTNYVFAATCPPGQICNPLSAQNFGQLLTKIADGVGTLIATLGTIMLIYAGILYLISAGSPDKITKAKTALIYAIIGIIIGLAAKVIVSIIKGIIGVSP